MAIGEEGQGLRSYEIRKRKYKQKVLFIIIMTVLIIMIVAAIFVYRLLHKNYTGYKVIHTIERNDSSSARYLSYGSGIIRFSRDGAMAMDGAGNLLWNGAYEMNDPIIDICGNYVAVSDRGYGTVQVYDEKGGVSTINVLKPILKTEVANQGVVAVLMDGNGRNYIDLYNLEGVSLVEKETDASKDGYPLDISLSDDGRKLVTSFVSIHNGKMKNWVTFYNFGEVGQNYEDRMVGGFDFEESLVPNVQFINNDTVCAFADNKFRIYRMKQIPELATEVVLPSEIVSVFYNEKNIGFTLKNKEGKAPYRVIVYDLNGKVLLDKGLNLEHANITISGDELIIYSDAEWKIWRLDGSEKLNYTFESNVSHVLPVNNLDQYIVIDDQRINEVKLIERQNQ